MKFSKYVLQRINYIFIYVIYCIALFGFLKLIGNHSLEIFIVLATSTILLIGIFLFDFYKKKKQFKELNQLIDNLEQKYLITEVMTKPYKLEDIEVYNIMKKANKSMIEEVSKVKRNQKEYKEYIESWVHEIKTPITSSMLLFENHKTETTRKLNTYMQEINNYVEQVLFYARLDNVENDYIIQKTDLLPIVGNVISKNKNLLIQNEVNIDISENLGEAYTDAKWIEFILNQIIINSIKYRKENPKIKIYSQKSENNVCLYIEDNGIGIKESEISRVFEKGFTGSNGRIHGKKSTGIGLYLCKNLSEKIGAQIQIESKLNEFTTIKLILPSNETYKTVREM